MLNNYKIIYFIIILLFKTSVSFANNLAIIDLDYLIENSNSGKLILDSLSLKDKENIDELTKKKNKLIKIENEIKSKQNIISEEAYNAEIENLKIKIEKFNQEKEILVENFNQYKNSKLNVFFKKITPIINTYMNENAIDILIEKKKIFINRENIDITKNILILINNTAN